jgi:ABC-type dipeptide/oligopeptide/nickel transport system permease subunit
MRKLAFPLFLIVLAAIARLARADDPRRLDLALELARPTLRHPLGCGDGGVDLLALASEALLRSLWLASIVALVALVIGTTLGGAAALAGGRLDAVLSRACDAVQAFPSFVLALGILAAVPHPTRMHVAVVLSLTAWAPFARLALAEIRVVRGLAYVEAARALGGSRARVLFRHALPAALPTARAQLGTTAAALLVSDAALAFLGVGPSDGVALGALLDQGLGAIVRAPHVLLVGAGALCLGALALQALADEAR